MLGRGHRFHGYGAIKAHHGRGQTVRGQGLALKYAPRHPSKPYRVAIVVSRKVDKSAVVRNRIRRRIYEVVRRSGNVPPATDLVFIVYSNQLADVAADALERSVEALLRKAASPSVRE